MVVISPASPCIPVLYFAAKPCGRDLRDFEVRFKALGVEGFRVRRLGDLV